jgi:phosphoribosyl-ATP pyrophosphohydrolase
LDQGLSAYGAKVLEEAEEVVRAARQEGRQRTVEEAADMLYHLLVLLRGEHIELDEVAEELRRRRRPPTPPS